MHYSLFPGMLLLDKSCSNKPERLEGWKSKSSEETRSRYQEAKKERWEKYGQGEGEGERGRVGLGGEREREKFVFVLLRCDRHIEWYNPVFVGLFC